MGFESHHTKEYEQQNRKSILVLVEAHYSKCTVELLEVFRNRSKPNFVAFIDHGCQDLSMVLGKNNIYEPQF